MTCVESKHRCYVALTTCVSDCSQLLTVDILGPDCSPGEPQRRPTHVRVSALLHQGWSNVGRQSWHTGHSVVWCFHPQPALLLHQRSRSLNFLFSSNHPYMIYLCRLCVSVYYPPRYQQLVLFSTCLCVCACVSTNQKVILKTCFTAWTTTVFKWLQVLLCACLFCMLSQQNAWTTAGVLHAELNLTTLVVLVFFAIFSLLLIYVLQNKFDLICFALIFTCVITPVTGCFVVALEQHKTTTTGYSKWLKSGLKILIKTEECYRNFRLVLI